jgi:hypothetical protein
MIKLSDYKNLFNKDVNVVCSDGSTFHGHWSEWWSAEENAEHAIDNDREPPGESVLVGVIGGTPTEIYASDIKNIEASESFVSVSIPSMSESRKTA